MILVIIGILNRCINSWVVHKILDCFIKYANKATEFPKMSTKIRWHSRQNKSATVSVQKVKQTQYFSHVLFVFNLFYHPMTSSLSALSLLPPSPPSSSGHCYHFFSFLFFSIVTRIVRLERERVSNWTEKELCFVSDVIDKISLLTFISTLTTMTFSCASVFTCWRVFSSTFLFSMILDMRISIF